MRAALALLAALLLAGVADAQQDFGIRPGQRIGPYRLDLTVADLQRLLAPFDERVTDSAPFQPHRVLGSRTAGVDAHVSVTGVRVLGLSAWKPAFRLPNGVAAGANEGVVSRVFPDLPLSLAGPGGQYYVDDRRGLALVADLGRIVEIVVFPPGGARLLFEMP